jgi:predicted DsbA family dithiol-disulfide isomerase
MPVTDAAAGEARPTAAVEIVYYTDPLCSWSWALEPQWRRLRYELGDAVRWRYRMGGLIPDWEHFSDPLNTITRPGQLGPLWMQVQETTGMPLDAGLWQEDPPSSSYPACLAFKAAERQGPWAAEAYLRRMREGAMLHRRNVARRDVLEALADEARAELPPELPFDVAQFSDELASKDVREALENDFREGRYQGIDRFPTLVIRGPRGTTVVCTGFRPYAALRQAVTRAAPDVQPQRRVEMIDYVEYFGRLTLRELSEALGLDAAATAEQVDEARRAGKIEPDALIG